LFLEDFSLPDMISKFEEKINNDMTASLVSVYTCNKEGITDNLYYRYSVGTENAYNNYVK